MLKSDKKNNNNSNSYLKTFGWKCQILIILRQYTRNKQFLKI